MAYLKLPDNLPADGATLRHWHVGAGQSYAGGTVLAELDTLDSLVHISASVAGQLIKQLAQPGQTLHLAGAPLAEVGVTSPAPTDNVTKINQTPPKEKSMTTDATGSAAVPILMPQAGNTMEEGRVLSWKVKVGDMIAIGQVICDIETDKATMEFESPVAGRLAKIVVPEGEAAPVKTPIAFVGEGDISNVESAPLSPREKVAQATPVARPGEGGIQISQVTEQSKSTTTDNRPKFSPAARVAAAQQNLDPLALASAGIGSGPGGRILSTDVPHLATQITTQAQSSARTNPAPATTPAVTTTPVSADGMTRKPMSKMRRAIGLNLQQSKQDRTRIFMYAQTIDADALLAYQKAMKPLAGCSINDVILYLLARTMKAFPAFRSRLEGDSIVEFAAVNLGVAVGIDDGLVVPVLMNADSRSLADLSAETKRIVENARKGKLENIGKATFTISNLGMFGVEEFAAIINPPEAGILAISAAREAVIVNNGSLRAGKVMTLTISADHRIVDGMLAAQFMAAFKKNLENPSAVA
ncbi:MAG: 2-oxo acid dehydrogenase subunit E2 [Phycisphaerales bacterium]|nr:2-oxo acid dehydrogenase subunit E2 [Phycisphaerales bacterium]